MDHTYDFLSNYYRNIDEDSRLESKHGQIEFLTTMHYVERYLAPGAKVIEIGAGTGRYSRAISGQGYSVEAVELFESNIEVFKDKLEPEHHINISQGNALDLSVFADDSFDITLLLGPMYHLYTKEDKQQALSEALRITKNDGVLFVAYCISDASIALGGFTLKHFNVEDFILRGKIDPVTFDTFSLPEDIIELVRKEDIDLLMEGLPAKRLHYVATDLLTGFISDTVDSMSEEEFVLYLRYHLAICERADMVGATHHSLDILSKMMG